MSLGVEIRSRTAPPGRGAFSLTDTLFLAGTFSAGPTEPTLVRSIADLEAAYGITRTSNAALWDYLDVFFREGGKRAWVLRYTAGAGNLATALELFSPDLGPGQVVAPSETMTATNLGVLRDHADANNRVTLADVANGDTVAAMTTFGGLITGLTGSEENIAGFGPWVEVPAPAGITGIGTRTVHGTAAVAGLIARADAQGNPNRAAAGRDFPLQYVTGFVRDITMAERIALLNAGVNTFADRFGVLQLYGFQTGVPQSLETPFWQLNCSRARMWLKARAQVAGEPFVFKPLDGRGRLARSLKSELDAICLELYGVDGLFGETPEEAFSVEVGSSVNTALTVAAGELHAVMEARLSLHAKRVLIDLVSVPVSGSVSSPE